MTTKPDMTKARELLENLTPIISHTAGGPKLIDILNEITQALDPQPEKFDWSGVKPGMAFRDRCDDELCFYVGQCLENPLFAVMLGTKINRGWFYLTFSKKDLTREPQFDKVRP